MNNQFKIKMGRKALAAYTLLFLLAFLGNMLSLNLFMGFYFFLASIFVLLILSLYSLKHAVAAAIVASLPTIHILGHPFALICFVIEPFFISLFRNRVKTINLIVAETIFWPIVAAPIIFFTYTNYLGLEIEETAATICMLWLNGITNSLVASLILYNMPIAKWLSLEEQDLTISVQNLLFNLLMAVILFPSIFMMVKEGRERTDYISSKIQSEIKSSFNTLRYELLVQMNRHFTQLDQLVDIAERTNSFRKDNYGEFSITASAISMEYPEIIKVMVYDDKLRTIYHSTSEPDRVDSTHFQSFLKASLDQDAPYICSFIHKSSLNSYSFRIAKRFIYDNWHLGTISIEIDTSLLSELAKRISLQENISFEIIDSNRAVLASGSGKKPGAILQEANSSNLNIFNSNKGIFHFSRGNERIDSRNISQKSLNRYYNLSKTIPWTVVVSAPAKQYYDSIILEHLHNMSAILLLCVTSLIISHLISMRLTRPIRRLSDFTTSQSTSFPSDDEISNIPSSNVSEIDQLVNNFKGMSRTISVKFEELAELNTTLEDRIQERTRELTEANAFLSMEIKERIKAEDDRDNYLNALQKQLEFQHTLMESIPNPIYFKDVKGMYMGCNSSFLKMAGLKLEDIAGKSVFEVYPVEQAEIYYDADQKLLMHGGTQQYETVFGQRDNLRDVIFYKATYSEGDGKTAGLVGVILDITERKKIENQRDQLTNELTIKNKELESIVYAASHDLRSPLINIQGFSRKVEKSCLQLKSTLKECLPGSDQNEIDEILNISIPKSLGFINTSTEKMDILLKGLLRLSRLGRSSLNPININMNRLISQVVDGLGFQIQSCGATLDISDLPPCFSDSDQINQVFSNLVDNALKYRSDERNPDVSISGAEDGRQVVYLVRDNGIGIAKEHTDKIWDIFHRINPAASQGEGLGLTIVRRIVERNGGTIRVESTKGEGTTFIVTLPNISKE